MYLFCVSFFVVFDLCASIWWALYRSRNREGPGLWDGSLRKTRKKKSPKAAKVMAIVIVPEAQVATLLTQMECAPQNGLLEVSVSRWTIITEKAHRVLDLAELLNAKLVGWLLARVFSCLVAWLPASLKGQLARLAWVRVCLLAWLHPWIAWLRGWLAGCLDGLISCLHRWMPACMPAAWLPARALACLPARMPACLLAYLPSWIVCSPVLLDCLLAWLACLFACRCFLRNSDELLLW